MSTGTVLVEALEAHGVRVVFGIPGTHNLELYRGLTRSGITHVAPRHEQGGGYAADGYARAGGRPGVVVTTSGPGLTNVLTAAATAYADSVPMLVLSPGVPRGRERADDGWLHEMKDQHAAADAVFDRSIRCGSPEAAVAALADTFARWRVERPRPVHLEIPLDVLEADCAAPVEVRPAPAVPGPPADLVARVAALLAEAQRPAILAGGGSVDAAGGLRQVAEALGAPVVTTAAGKGVLDERHPLAVGAFGGYDAAIELLAGADVLLVVGSEVGDAEFGRGRLVPAGHVVRVDLSPAQLHKNIRADVPVLGAAAATLDALAALLGGDRAGGGDRVRGDGPGRAAAARGGCLAAAEAAGGHWRPIQDRLAEQLPEDTVLVGDSSQVSYLGSSPFYRMARPRQFLSPVGFSTLGYAVPAAIGAKLADPSRPVVALLGDGAFTFSPQELLTAAELRLPIPVVVVDNGGYGEIRENMRDRSIPALGVDLPRPDFPLLARALGCAGATAGSAEEVAALAAKALTADRPTVINLEVRR